jgi:hypothetical protein
MQAWKDVLGTFCTSPHCWYNLFYIPRVISYVSTISGSVVGISTEGTFIIGDILSKILRAPPQVVSRTIICSTIVIIIIVWKRSRGSIESECSPWICSSPYSSPPSGLGGKVWTVVTFKSPIDWLERGWGRIFEICSGRFEWWLAYCGCTWFA